MNRQNEERTRRFFSCWIPTNSSTSARHDVLTAKLLVMIVDLGVVFLGSSVVGAEEWLEDFE